MKKYSAKKMHYYKAKTYNNIKLKKIYKINKMLKKNYQNTII